MPSVRRRKRRTPPERSDRPKPSGGRGVFWRNSGRHGAGVDQRDFWPVEVPPHYAYLCVMEEGSGRLLLHFSDLRKRKSRPPAKRPALLNLEIGRDTRDHQALIAVYVVREALFVKVPCRSLGVNP